VHVRDLMHKDAALPLVRVDASLKEALLEMTRKGLGMTAIVDEQDRVLGIFTDGDLRRTLDKTADIHGTLISQVMGKNPRTIAPEVLAAEAVQQMEQYKINGLLVADAQQRLVGALNMHDLLRAGVV
jgi:arabinose-5-phosphate isomerase